ncbi:hypothetical protein LTR56_021970 [Elasticomyces elasticus]|nr:hypothetical protein LTR56_021970 [Elasticomyces elasticus]KAK3629651.1 hypothetical protein LTR22_021821 [Elasticomyces elasticus]KAK4911250.1 hypothetical protein LTR49_020138 [Elasticomyces elasticus]KAK5756298.1 hypothetical protein LTS12_013604 [Elasticomyces elasticus]
MPSLCGINVSLQSQYDALTIPEYPLADDASSMPKLDDRVDELKKTADVQIPIYQSSQFWLSYTCPPAPEGCTFRFYYFKLFVKDRYLVSWGTGEEEDWSGKTVFGLYDGGHDFERRRVVEKRGFFFPSRGITGIKEQEMFEVRVFRSIARKREKGVIESFERAAFKDAGFYITKIGRLEKGEYQRRYTYALLDPVDEPYVVFKYHAQGATPTHSPSSSSSQDAVVPENEPSDRTGSETGLYRRLSVPPRKQLLLPPDSSDGARSLPVKKFRRSEHALDGDGARGSGASERGNHIEDEPRDWDIETPSPVKAERIRLERADTPPSARAKNGSISLLRGVIANALRRRDGSGNSGRR